MAAILDLDSFRTKAAHREKVRALHPMRRELLEYLTRSYPEHSEERHLEEMEREGF